MIKINFPPPGHWTCVIIKWDDVLAGPQYPINKILEWINEYEGGLYHLVGYKSTEGFEFMFERAEDAVLLKLKWL